MSIGGRESPDADTQVTTVWAFPLFRYSQHIPSPKLCNDFNGFVYHQYSSTLNTCTEVQLCTDDRFYVESTSHLRNKKRRHRNFQTAQSNKTDSTNITPQQSCPIIPTSTLLMTTSWEVSTWALVLNHCEHSYAWALAQWSCISRHKANCTDWH